MRYFCPFLGVPAFTMIEKILDKIKQKKTLQDIDNQIINKHINNYFKENPKELSKIKNIKSASFKKAVKEIRCELNRIYGTFIINNKLSLDSRTSAKERKSIYKQLYQDIFKITAKPKKILDLACGYNPLSYIDLKDIEFIVTELIKKDVDKLNKFFKENKIKGKAIQQDLLTQTKFPKSDICFLFKIIDVLETKKNKSFTENLIKKIPAKHLVISFATKTLKGKKMNYPRRGWLERMLKRLNYKYHKLIYSNEIFYLIKK